MNQALENDGPALAHYDPLSELNRVLGQRRAFATVSGRCSAAHAELLRRIRAEKLYGSVAGSWREFCGGHIAISRRQADRLIGLIIRFGPAYFELAELVGITPEQYAVIEPAIQQGRLHSDGESISLVSENSSQLADAIHEILAAAPPARPAPLPVPPAKRLARLAARGRSLVTQLRVLYDQAPSDADRNLILEAVNSLRAALRDLDAGSPPSPPSSGGA